MEFGVDPTATGAEEAKSGRGSSVVPATAFTPEQILREEIRSTRDLTFKMVQWGVTVLVASLTALFYGRRAFRDDFVALKRLNAGEQLPLKHYLIGTVLLLIIASVFSFLTHLAQRRTQKFRRQLDALSVSGIVEPSNKPFARWALMLLYLIFPLFDAAVRFILFELDTP
jgi:hypothetical protein